uniref:SAUR family protein 39 n=1 Tax=Morus alba TaxID=3498 RepID=A0A075BRW4_MORAL|nr:SAUR family protein 39 [Morus alba]
MSPAIAKSCNKIRHIVRLRQMLQQWRRKARIAASRALPPPPDVPAGHLAVCVGSSSRRFIVRATYMNHPMFKKLLVQAEEEYGFASYNGPLSIPCVDEAFFEEVLRVVSRSDSSNSGRFCHVDIRKRLDLLGAESRPLLHDLSDKSIC